MSPALCLPADGRASEVCSIIGDGSAAGTVVGGSGPPRCGTLLLHGDETYEHGYAWSDDGVVAPSIGGFAECYTLPGPALLCAVVIDISTAPSLPQGGTWDAYVWGDLGGVPGAVLCASIGNETGTVASFPEFSRKAAPLGACCVEGVIWAGCWGTWPGETNHWWLGADLTGPDGCAFTNAPPGSTLYPAGWISTDLVFGALFGSFAHALGIGVEVTECGVIPVGPSTWGSIKALYQRSP